MRNLLGVLPMFLVTSLGCSSENIGSDVEVEGIAPALLGSCDPVIDELPDYAARASIRAQAALDAYNADEFNETVVKYFGQNYSHEIFRARLTELSQLGVNPGVTFWCLSEDQPTCTGEWSTTALYTDTNEHEKDTDFNIFVCGDRFWTVQNDTDPDRGGGKDSLGTASRTGAMVHELAHLTGALSGHTSGLREQIVIDDALTPIGSQFSVENAEAYRFYVMNVP